MTSLLLVTRDGADTARVVARAWNDPSPLHLVDAGCVATRSADVAGLDRAEVVVVACGADADAGHDTCRQVRQVTDAPMCLVTAQRHEADELLALTTGCDDYMSTQSASEVLRARLAGLAARGRRAARTEVTTFGALELDPELRTVEVNGVPLTLTRIEFDLLHALITHQRRVVPRWELLATGWESPPTGHVLDVHMSRLRRKVLDAGGPKVGEPVPGVGYRAGSPDRPPCGDHPAESDVATRVS